MAWWQRQFEGTTRGRVVTLLRRGQRSVEEIAVALGLTDNAVRAQLAALERDAVVTTSGVRHDGTVGKPAMLYDVAPGTTALFSSAYAPMLRALLEELGARIPPIEIASMLRAAGRRIGASLPAAASFRERVRAGAAILVGLGAEADLVRSPNGYEIRGYGCPLAEAVAACPATCGALEQLLSDVTRLPVQERCDRSSRPNCRFFIPMPM